VTLNADGTFTYTPPADFNGTDTFTYKVNDGTVDGNVATVTITVNPVNDDPVLGTNSGLTLNEGATATITTAALEVTDVDNTPAELTYTVTVVPGNGQLELTTSPGTAITSFTQADIDANRLVYVHDDSNTTSDSFTFTVDDGAGGSLGATVFNITVTAVNDAPTDLTATALAVDEGAANGTVVGTVTGVDADDPPANLSYSLLDDAGGRFAINASTGEITVADGTLLDYDIATSHGIIVRVTDGGGLTYDEAFTVTVNNVNTAPVATDDSYSVNEDSTLTVDWWNTDWTQRQKLTIDNSAQTENLTDFPVLVKLNSGNIDYGQVQDNGQDLRFFDADGTALAYEIESWNEAGDSYVWVQVPQIDGGSNTDFIWMYYGNASAPAQQSSGFVWDNSYAGVWHLNEDQAGTGTPEVYQDSGSSAYHGDDFVSATGQTGQIGAGQEFDGVDDYIDTGTDDPLDITGELTISAWVYRESNGTVHHIASKNDGSGLAPWQFAITTSNQLRYFASESTTVGDWETIDSTDTVALNEWHHVAMVRTATEITFFIDGVQDSGGWQTLTKAPSTSDTTAKIGAHGDASNNFFDGFLDEVRISGVARSADWMAAEHLATAGAFVSFVSFGGAETAPAQGGVTTNDSDADVDRFNAILVSGPSNAASFTFNPDGTFSYTPTADFNGTDTFTYKLNDGTADSNIATVTITVDPVNDAPVLDNLGAMTLSNIIENDTTNQGDLVSDIIASAGGDRITDVDAGAVEGIAVTSVDDSNGTWEYSTAASRTARRWSLATARSTASASCR